MSHLFDQYGERIPTRVVRRPLGFLERDPVDVSDDENEPLNVQPIDRGRSAHWLSTSARQIEARR